MDFQTWLLFLITEFLLVISPGPAVLVVSSQALKYGRKYSSYGSLGIIIGNAMYFALSALGLATLIMTTRNLFEIIKIGGAIYLIISGLIMIYKTFKESDDYSLPQNINKNYFKAFLHGFIVQAANPKAIIFFVALLPQFIDISRNVFLQLLILGLTSIILEFIVLVFYASIAAKGRNLVEKNKTFSKWQGIVSGTVLIGIGINLFLIKGKSL